MSNAPTTVALSETSAIVKTRRRPFGLNAIITIQLLTMLGSATVLTLVTFALVMAQRMGELEHLDLKLTPVDVATLVLTLVVNGVCAVGLWRRQRWAWFLTMLQLGAFMVSDLYSYFTNSPPATYAWSMLLNVFMVFYLNQREVQAIFLSKDE
jgi:uncharacterized membrane protein (DUF2068 family)